MISNSKFVEESLGLNLFFLRIMKEHMIFIGQGLTPKDFQFKLISEKLKNKLEELLRRSIRISNGLINSQVLLSGEIVTNYTLLAEKKTEFYTGAHISTDITEKEIDLIQGKGHKYEVNSNIVREVESINKNIMIVIKDVINFKSRIKQDVKTCKVFTTLYPTLIDHVLREAEFYLNMVNRLQQREEVNIGQEIFGEETFWNVIMREHSEFIRGLLDTSETKLFKEADNFSRKFKSLEDKSNMVEKNIEELRELTKESLKYTQELKEFKKQGTEGILSCNVKSIIIPLLADHVLREANHYLRLLTNFDKK